jgi:glycosyltransferase involved in cell wall biosynthesis
MRDMVVLPRVGLKAMQLFVLPNLLQPGTNSPAESIELPLWNKTPVLFFGRMDSLKAPEELIRAAHLVKDFSRNHILVFAGPLGHGVDMFKELRGSGLDFVMLPSIPFDKTESFLKAVALRNGTYVTCSRAESLGLSLLEAYMAGLRIVATDIPAHRLILESNKFVSFYPPGQIVELAKELSNLNHRDLGSSAELDTRGMEDRFVQTWEAILSNRGIS